MQRDSDAQQATPGSATPDRTTPHQATPVGTAPDRPAAQHPRMPQPEAPRPDTRDTNDTRGTRVASDARADDARPHPPHAPRTHRLTLPAYLLANAASLFGNAAIAVVLPWLVLERTGDPALAGVVAAASALPGAAATFLGGWLIDHLGRHRMAVLSDVGSAVSVAGLALVDHLTGLTVTWFVVLGLLGALFDGPGMTARSTLLKNVADTSGWSLERISGLQGAVFGLSFLLGPAAAGALLALMPSIHVVWVTAACSALAALAIAVMPLAPHGHEPAEDDSPLAGLSYVRRSRPLRVLLVVQLGSAVLVAPLLSIVLPAHFSAMEAPGLLGLSLSGYALGTVLGSVVYGWGMASRQWAAWAACQACYMLFALLVAPLTGFWLIAVGMFVAGIGSGLLQPIANVILTRDVPEGLRGRVFAVFSTLSLVGSPVGLGVITAVVAGAGLGPTAWMMAVGWVVLAGYGLAAPGMRRSLSRLPDEPEDPRDSEAATDPASAAHSGGAGAHH